MCLESAKDKIFISKVIFRSLGLSAFVFLPLAALSLGVALIEVLKQPLKIGQRKEEYRIAFKFYQELLNYQECLLNFIGTSRAVPRFFVNFMGFGESGIV